MAYTFDQIFAADPSNPERVASNGVVTIFAPGDETRTPLLISSVDGMVIQNPVQVNDSGHGPAFIHETLDRVAWEGGGLSGFLTSYDGMKDEAVAARVAAEAAANSAVHTDAAVERVISTEGTDARGAVEEVVALAAASKLDRDEAAVSYVDRSRSDTARVALGTGALTALPSDYDLGPAGTAVALGYQALGEARQVKKAIAIGTGAMSQGTVIRDNIAIGEAALRNVQSGSVDYSQSDLTGTRNIALGGNAGRFITTGWGHTVIGRNAGQCLVGGNGAVAIGLNAMAGTGPIGLSGEIENGAPWGGVDQVRSVAVGANAAMSNTAQNNVAVGGESLRNVKRSDFNVAIGSRALASLDTGTGYGGGQNIELNLQGTYSQSGSVLTITATGHGLVVGDTVRLRLLTGASQTFLGDIAHARVASVPSSSTFTVAHPTPRVASGDALIVGKETAAQQPLNQHNVAVGAAGAAMATGSWNAVLGGYALNLATRASTATAVGYKAFSDAESVASSVAVGANAAGRMVGAALNVTAVGSGALTLKIDGTPLTETWGNVTGLGSNATVTGHNQVQLGNSETTTYVYGTVQNRSDARDKADIRDTALGLDFIEKLRPVDFRWDMRDDYVQIDEEGNATRLDKDGSKKRSRYHHGFVAQEVQQVIEETGEDFGGLQDHSINGGSDVLSIGYDEVIAPLVKAVQELTARVIELEGKH